MKYVYAASVAAVREPETAVSEVAPLRYSMQHLVVMVIARSDESALSQARVAAAQIWKTADNWQRHSVQIKKIGIAPKGAKEGVSV